MKSILLPLLFLVFSTSIFAQSECSYYHKKACQNKDNYPMKYDSQSKSAILGKGQISEFHMVAYNGLDYRVSLCAEENLGSQIQFKIYEKKRELVKKDAEGETSSDDSSEDYSDDYSDDYSASYDDAYSDDMGGESNNDPKFRLVKELLYDNASDEFSNQIEFTADGSMSLIIEVHVPGEESSSRLKIRETGCVGVLIEHVKSQQVGFH